MSKYDLAVVGDGFGGLTAAALLGNIGKKAVVITGGGSLDDVLSVTVRDGFRFPSAPSLAYGFEHGGVSELFLRGLGMADLLQRTPEPYQVALPDRRITLSLNHEETLAELRREFPRECEAVVRFYRDLNREAERMTRSKIAAFFAKRTSVSRIFRRRNLGPELLTFFNVQSLFFFRRPFLDLSVAAAIELCLTRPVDCSGIRRLAAERLLPLILQQGGDIRYGAGAICVTFRNRRAVGVETRQGGVEAERVLMVSRQGRNQLFLLGVRDEVVPVGMSRHVIWLPDYAQPDAFLVLALNSSDDRDAAPPGMRSLTVQFPASEHSYGNEERIRAISGIVPFLEDFLVFSDEPRSMDGPSVPNDMTFRPVSAGDGSLFLGKSSKKTVFKLEEQIYSPLLNVPAVQAFVRSVS